MGLGLEFQKTNQNKNQYPRYLGLKFEKNSVSDIRISILGLCVCVCICVCVCVCVCVFQFSLKTKSFGFFKLAKNWFRVGEFRKLAIRISILKIICMPIFKQSERLRLFSPNLPKNEFRVGNWENWCRNKNQHPQDTLCANFRQKWITLTFLA